LFLPQSVKQARSLDFPKALLTILREDLRDRLPFGRLDFAIDIDRTPPQSTRNKSRDGALARSAESD
jgi:hypothetical protein